MANCNCNDFPISCAPHAPGGDCCHHPHGCPPHPCPPPNCKGGTSMYIGARYVPIFADPVEWDDEREYEPLTIVVHNGDCYTSKCYVPKGAQLPPYPDGQTKYWVKTSDYNYQFADLKKTVTDLSRLVEQFQKDNEKFTELINGWNEKVIQWEKDMAAWGERLDTVESTVSDLTDSLNAEIARAKAAEQANAAAIAKETTDRQQAISELDAAYKAADATEAQTRSEADTALSNRITANRTDIDALKAEQKIQNTNISNNAKNIADNSAEIAKHAARLTSLESNASDWDSLFPDTTIAQEMQKEELARANGDTALNGRCDAIAADVEEVRDIANHKVDQTVFNKADALNVKFKSSTKGKINPGNMREGLVTKGDYVAVADAKVSEIALCEKESFKEYFGIVAAQNAANTANATIGNWNTAHPRQTISECATSVENEIAAVDAKADANAANIGNWNAEHPGKTISQAVSDIPSFNNVNFPTNGYDLIHMPNGAGATFSAGYLYVPLMWNDVTSDTSFVVYDSAHQENVTTGRLVMTGISETGETSTCYWDFTTAPTVDTSLISKYGYIALECTGTRTGTIPAYPTHAAIFHLRGTALDGTNIRLKKL